MIKLIAVDLDGTLVHEHEIAEEDREALLRVLDKNIPLVPTTTRLRISTARFFDGILIDRYPLICNNGARILGAGWSDPSGCSVWKELRIKAKIAEKVASYADKKDYELSTVFPEKVYRRNHRPKKSEDRKIGFVQKNMEALKHGTPINFMIHKVANDLETLVDLEKFVSENFREDLRLDRHHRGEEYRSLTIYDKGVSKLKALRSVCDRFDVGLDEVLAIGDDEVDKKMIEEAGIGVAMDNSPENIKEAADEIAPNCEKNGVAWVLNEYLPEI